MSSTSPREELLQLHQRIYRQNKRSIDESVIHEDKSFRAYERRYLRSVRDYKSIATPEECTQAILESQIVYVGDYHTLNQSQRSLLRILRVLVEQTKDFCLAMEVIQRRHQDSVDHYLKGRLKDAAFLKKIGFREHWFFDLWDNFKPLFDFSRYHGISVFGIEADPTDGLSLQERDTIMAEHILDIHWKNPGKIIIVFVGDLHLAPAHLPREVNKQFKKNGMRVKTLTLYQNSESIYWKLAKKEIEDQALIVRISDNEFCRMHTPPIIAQQSYLNWLEHEEEVLDYADARTTFLGYVEKISQFLGLNLSPESEEVEVFTCGDLSFLKKLHEAKVFSTREIREIKRQILRSESYYIPKMKYVYLANVSVNHAAEEASHCIRHLCAGDESPRPMQDAFYASIIHEALGFFGSKIINPRRKCLHPTDCRKLLSYLKLSESYKERGLDYQIARLFLEHEKSMSRKVPFSGSKIATLPVDLFIGLTHALGYYLGERMFNGLLQGFLDKDYIKEIYLDPLDEEGEPVKLYLDLVDELIRVKIPRKL